MGFQKRPFNGEIFHRFDGQISGEVCSTCVCVCVCVCLNEPSEAEEKGVLLILGIVNEGLPRSVAVPGGPLQYICSSQQGFKFNVITPPEM